MCSEKSLQDKFLRGLGLAVGLLLAGPWLASDALAQGGERLAPFLRQYAAPQERPAREMPAFAAEPMRRQDADDSRNPRRWSPEERRQLRRDVHEAGRDVYGRPPHRHD